jgi:hypothetical protein
MKIEKSGKHKYQTLRATLSVGYPEWIACGANE